MSSIIKDSDESSKLAVDEEEVGKAVSLLVDKYGARRVFLFGSFARGETRKGSDIDLAVEGLPESEFFNAYGELLYTLSREVDLLDLSGAKNSLRERVKREGVLLGEK